MPTPRIPTSQPTQIYFITPTVRRWYYLFDRHDRWRIIADSLRYCRQHKELKLFGYVFMMNHLHLLIQSPDAISFLRDFKRHTARAIFDNIRQTEPKLENFFLTEKGESELWLNSNMPEPVEQEAFLRQKLDYIHNNPVRKQYVREAKDWYWSSALYYETGRPEPMEIDPIEI
ncbi:MAG: hypothetical protein C4523_18040 [Myxococcales bacterium]|nr:MAG: hypothetical protein C4523_18040 [Myxococcales bacterium]